MIVYMSNRASPQNSTRIHMVQYKVSNGFNLVYNLNAGSAQTRTHTQ